MRKIGLSVFLSLLFVTGFTVSRAAVKLPHSPGSEGFPASPFQSDDWKGFTEGVNE